MHQLLTGISLSIRIHTRESSLCCIIRVQQKPLPNRTVLFSKVLLYRISSSLWPLVKQGNKLGEGRQVKFRRPKLQMTGFFWRICTYTWFGLKASFLWGRREQRIFFAFRFIWPPRSAWPKELVKLRQLRPYIQLSSPSGAYSRSIVTDLGRLGTVFTGFELIEYASVLTGQRIFTNKRKGCWFKTQKVWGKFQRKVVAELELLLRHKTESVCRGKSHSPEGAHNTFEKERICFWGFLTNFTCNIFWNTHFPYLL